jgi:hypothetical protein
MRSLGTRRLVLVAGLAAATAVAFAGCSAGQVAETSLKKPSNQGVNEENSNNTVAIRNLSVAYNGTEGYAAGDSAPLEVSLYNQTNQPITVLVSSRQPDAALGTEVVSGTDVVLVGAQPSTPSSAAPEPSAESPSPSPSESGAAAGTPARIVLDPLGYASFLPGDAESLQVQGLSAQLRPGMSVNLIFEFSNGAAPLTLQAPVGIPLSPAPRESANPAEKQEE